MYRFISSLSYCSKYITHSKWSAGFPKLSIYMSIYLSNYINKYVYIIYNVYIYIYVYLVGGFSRGINSKNV